MQNAATAACGRRLDKQLAAAKDSYILIGFQTCVEAPHSIHVKSITADFENMLEHLFTNDFATLDTVISRNVCMSGSRIS